MDSQIVVTQYNHLEISPGHPLGNPRSSYLFSIALMILLQNQMIHLLFGSDYFEAPLFISLMQLKFLGVGFRQLCSSFL